MKITQTPQRAYLLQIMRAQANEGCYACPYCGTDDSTYIVHTCKTWAKGLIKIRHMKVDCYRCKVCGAEWESDAYEDM